jgi:hypothetical protein
MFNTFDYLPIDEPLLQSDIQSDPSLSLAYKHQMALAHHAALCENRLLELSKYSTKAAKETFDYQEALYYYTTSLLCQLLSLSGIASEGKEAVHYVKVKNLLGREKRLPPPERLRDISYGMNLSWGAMYGSLGYYLFLGTPAHYASPSQLIRQAVLSYLSFLGSNFIDTDTESLIYQLINLINTDSSLEGDWNLYSFSRHLIFALDDVRDCFPHLVFLEGWLLELEEWYSSNYRSGGGLPNLLSDDRQERRAYQTLAKAGQLWLRHGQKVDSLPYNYIHQLIPDTWGGFYSDLIVTLKQTEYDMSLPVAPGSLAERLLVPALQTIKVTSNPDSYRYGTDTILRQLIGGYDTFLICISSELVNRAHTLSNPANPTNIKRCLGLLHLASLTLKKSSLSRVRQFGDLIGTSCGSPFTNPSITNLEVL